MPSPPSSVEWCPLGAVDVIGVVVETAGQPVEIGGRAIIRDQSVVTVASIQRIVASIAPQVVGAAAALEGVVSGPPLKLVGEIVADKHVIVLGPGGGPQY